MKAMRILKYVVVFIGVVTSIVHCYSEINAFIVPRLVYEIEQTKAPMLLGQSNIDYYVTSLIFRNDSRRTASIVQAEVTVAKPTSTGVISCSPAAQVNVIISEMPASNTVMIRSDQIASYGWTGSFDTEIQAATSLSEFRNTHKEGNAIVRNENGVILLGYKEHLHPGQSGTLQIRSFWTPLIIDRVNFQSSEVIGKKAQSEQTPTIESILSNKLFTNMLILMMTLLLVPWGLLRERLKKIYSYYFH